ncbi:MAG: SH3 domain-containing protein [Saprospiraceae bacterium]|nr:SH3 domain-containing protein [Saprospiraceae bacterium]
MAAASSDEKSTPLYVTIEGLNLRIEPNVSAEVIAKLPLFEKVYFLNETTDFKKEIDWGNGLVTNEPWIKIRTENGRSGWVYGVGVHFYKRTFDFTAADSTKVTK